MKIDTYRYKIKKCNKKILNLNKNDSSKTRKNMQKSFNVQRAKKKPRKIRRITKCSKFPICIQKNISKKSSLIRSALQEWTKNYRHFQQQEMDNPSTKSSVNPPKMSKVKIF